jgi:hypothetical protein
MRANRGANPKGSKKDEDERYTGASSNPRGRMADFNLVTHQNMELSMTFQLSLKSTMNRGL